MSIYRVNVKIASAAVIGPAVNTWHIRTDGVDDDGDNAIGDLMESLEGYYLAIRNEHAAGTIFDFDGVVTQVAVEDGAIIAVDPWTVASTTAQATLPVASAVMVRWQSSLASRSGRGRSFHSPIGTNANGTNGNVDAASRTVFLNAANALIASFTGPADGAFGVFSREDNVIRDFVSASVGSKFAVLRSRRD